MLFGWKCMSFLFNWVLTCIWALIKNYSSHLGFVPIATLWLTIPPRPCPLYTYIHKYFLINYTVKKYDLPPVCTINEVLLTVKHVLAECIVCQTERRKLNIISDHLTETLNPKPTNIIDLCQFLTITYRQVRI